MQQKQRTPSSTRLSFALAALFACTFIPLQAHAGGTDTVALGTYSHLHSPGTDGGMESYASGGGLSILLLDRDDEVSLGGQIQASFLSGEEGRRVYDLGVSFVISYGLEDKPVVPYMRLGLDLVGTGDNQLNPERARSVMTGVHAAGGLHGYLSDKLYWRAEVGFLGAGPGGVQSQFGIGYSFGDF